MAGLKDNFQRAAREQYELSSSGLGFRVAKPCSLHSFSMPFLCPLSIEAYASLSLVL